MLCECGSIIPPSGPAFHVCKIKFGLNNMCDFFYALNFYGSNDFGEHWDEQINKINGCVIVTEEGSQHLSVTVHP